MYNLSYFKEDDLTVVKAFMHNNPFAIITGVDANQFPVATQVPLLLEEKDGRIYLYGHVQRKTDHHLAFESNPKVLVLFTGPHSYVSASWYSNKQTASTWNYITVHARGAMKLLDEAALLTILAKTTTRFESDPFSPALVEKMSAQYLEKMMKAIVGFEIEVTALDNVYKLSQNRDKESYERIVEELKLQGGDAKAIAAEMEKRRS
jgi:transcriptional regulator